MFWVLPASLIASGLAVFKFGYLSKVQVALGLQTAEETGSLQELLRLLQSKSEGIYTVIRLKSFFIFVVHLSSLLSYFISPGISTSPSHLSFVVSSLIMPIILSLIVLLCIDYIFSFYIKHWLLFHTSPHLSLLSSSPHQLTSLFSGTINSDHPIVCDLAKTNDGTGMHVVMWAKNIYRVFEEWSRVTKRWNAAAQKLVHEFRETTFHIMDQTGR